MGIPKLLRTSAPLVRKKSVTRSVSKLSSLSTAGGRITGPLQHWKGVDFLHNNRPSCTALEVKTIIPLYLVTLLSANMWECKTMARDRISFNTGKSVFNSILTTIKCLYSAAIKTYFGTMGSHDTQFSTKDDNGTINIFNTYHFIYSNYSIHIFNIVHSTYFIIII
ncbi:hypothetical protein BGZ94_007701 [Podila epigama]|nr:hypothetical protein BGZ94_007701 [Podila epigama]